MAHRSDKYTVDPLWGPTFEKMGVDLPAVLVRAGLTPDALQPRAPRLPAEQFFALWEAAEDDWDGENFAIGFAVALSAEAFHPARFAFCCSPDLLAAFHRLARYSWLTGPVVYAVDHDATRLRVFVERDDGVPSPPNSLVEWLLANLVELARSATGARISPLKVDVAVKVELSPNSEEFFGVTPRAGETAAVEFGPEDAGLRILTPPRPMWEACYSYLGEHYASVGEESPIDERVGAALLNLLPAGRGTVNAVASELEFSRRTLQRRLRRAETSFQVVLADIRHELAHHYLGSTPYSSPEIAFLLGFDDPSSFYRAFRDWTGTSPESVRRRLAN